VPDPPPLECHDDGICPETSFLIKVLQNFLQKEGRQTVGNIRLFKASDIGPLLNKPQNGFKSSEAKSQKAIEIREVKRNPAKGLIACWR